MNKYLIFTCEHSGNKVPPQFLHLFEGQRDVLNTHRGYDIGALELAEKLSANMKAPVFYADISRLVVELNRSRTADDFFSDFTARLSPQEKEWVTETFYEPYRQLITGTISNRMDYFDLIMHISVHTFTPEWNGEKRKADIGLLFDPSHTREKEFCKLLKSEIGRLDKKLIVKHNYPYLGTADGFTTTLRSSLPEERYAGIEIEVNQKYPLAKDSRAWNELMNTLSLALEYTWLKFGE